MRLQVSIVAPDRIFLAEEAKELILPTSTGQIGVLRSHAPLITALDIGLIILLRGSRWESLALMGGFALVQENQVTILVNEAVAAASLDENEVEKSLEQATNYLRQVSEEKDKVRATISFKRARARYQVRKQK
jgi:ATP synthase F1 epsilon subunit